MVIHLCVEYDNLYHRRFVWPKEKDTSWISLQHESHQLIVECFSIASSIANHHYNELCHVVAWNDFQIAPNRSVGCFSVLFFSLRFENSTQRTDTNSSNLKENRILCRRWNVVWIDIETCHLLATGSSSVFFLLCQTLISVIMMLNWISLPNGANASQANGHCQNALNEVINSINSHRQPKTINSKRWIMVWLCERALFSPFNHFPAKSFYRFFQPFHCDAMNDRMFFAPRVALKIEHVSINHMRTFCLWTERIQPSPRVDFLFLTGIPPKKTHHRSSDYILIIVCHMDSVRIDS